jgi:predicted PurR-regulated permease PerM
MNLSPITPQQRPSSSPVNEPVAADQIAPVKALIDQETKVVLPAEVLEEMPLPSDPKVTFLGGLFILALLAAAYVASEIVLPFVFAIVLKLLLQPAFRMLEGLHVPRILASLLLILALFGTIVGLGAAISSPARTWAAKLPEGIPRLQERLSFMREPIDTLQRFLHQVEDFGGPATSPRAAAPAQGPTLLTNLFKGTRNFASGFFTTVLFLFFLLVSGDIFLHRLVEVLPRFKSKRQVVEISQQIESDISAYLVTITVMNVAVGIATAFAMWLTGVGDPILWGSVAFLLNYVPILGPTLGVLIFFLAGLLTYDVLWQALLPAGFYLGFHLIEGEMVTPMLLARRFTLNPVLVMISLVFWFWMWGIPGAILALPMLAITKIICDQLQPLAAFGHFLEG